MILRLWRGWTATPAQAQAYQDLLNGTIAPAIMARGITGLHELVVARRVPDELDPSGQAEFATLMSFEDWPAVLDFTGGDPKGSVVPPAARAVLSRFDPHSAHYEVLRRHLP